jgi:hypothetical protein
VAGTGINDLLSVGAAPAVEGETPLLVAVYNEEGWDDLSELANRLPSFGTAGPVAINGIYDIVKTSDVAVMVGTAADASGASPHAVAFVSVAATVP